MRSSLFALVVFLTAVAHAQAQTFNVGANFQTATGGAVGTDAGLVTPPDTQGAAGQNHITILNNGVYKTFSKTGTVAQSLTDTAFFSAAGYSGAGGFGVLGDPRIQFDPLSGRWFALEFTQSPSGGDVNNRLVIAVSENANPTGVWKSTTIQTTNGTFADFPTLAIDANGIYIGTNNFNAGGGFTGSSIFTATKGGLLWTGAGSPTLTNFTAHEGLAAGTAGSTIQAANNFDPNQSGTNNRVIASGGFSGGDYFIRTYNIQNTIGTTTLGAGSFVNIGPTNAPPNAAQPGGTTIDTGASQRIGGQSVQVGDRIYTALAFDDGSGRSKIRVSVFVASSGLLDHQRVISDASLSFYFPTIAVNELGHAVVGFSGSSSGQFVSSYAAVSTSAGTLNFSAAQLVSAGGGSYAGFDGSPFRWGDYSAVTVDPADTGIFWSFQERATAVANTYATQATEIIPTIANEVRWRNAADGNYSTATNWFNNAAPGAGSHAIYSRNGAAHIVTLPALVTTSNDRISVRQGTTTFNITPGSTYQATNASALTPSFAVSQHLGETTLNVTGGGTLSTVFTTLAAGENGRETNNISKATVNINGATWTNSQDVHFGGSATRAGGQAQLNISNAGTVSVGQVARFWTSSSGVNLNGATAVSLSVGGLRADSGVNPIITGTGATANLNITNGLGQNYFGQINGTVNLTKSGAGTQTLSGNMNYTGVTTINSGRLNINGVKSGAGAVNVNNTGVLGGTGSVAGVVTVAAGGTIAPGLSPGNLTLTGGLNMVAGTYEWELAAFSVLNPGTDFDQLDLNGGASVLGGSSQVLLAFPTAGVNPNVANAFWNTTHQWTIVDLLSGTLTGNFGSITNPNFSTGSFFLSGGNGADVFLNFAPVPEPSSIAFVGGSLLCLVFWRRRRSRPANGNQ